MGQSVIPTLMEEWTVNHLSRPWRRPLLRVLVLALAVAAAPLPVLAGEPTPPTNPTLKASIQKVVAQEIAMAAKAPVARSAQSSGGTTTDLASPSFFKTKAGVITLVATVVGVGFALYSTSNDRVKSPAK